MVAYIIEKKLVKKSMVHFLQGTSKICEKQHDATIFAMQHDVSPVFILDEIMSVSSLSMKCLVSCS